MGLSDRPKSICRFTTKFCLFPVNLPGKFPRVFRSSERSSELLHLALKPMKPRIFGREAGASIEGSLGKPEVLKCFVHRHGLSQESASLGSSYSSSCRNVGGPSPVSWRRSALYALCPQRLQQTLASESWPLATVGKKSCQGNTAFRHSYGHVKCGYHMVSWSLVHTSLNEFCKDAI